MKRDVYPREVFKQDIISFIINSICNSWKVILSIDINENTTDGKLSRILRGLGLLEMLEYVSEDSILAIYTRGSKQIDVVWVIENIKVKVANLYLFNFIARDY